jgi:HSP20 family molecular chaperone IbpA
MKMVTHRLRRFFEPQIRAPWGLFEELERDFAQLFPMGSGRQSVRVWASEDAAVIEIDAPGVEAEVCDISVENDLVEVGVPAQSHAIEGRAHLKERDRGNISQQVRLPFPLDPARTEAVYERGVLRVSVHRREDSKPSKVTVKAG